MLTSSDLYQFSMMLVEAPFSFVSLRLSLFSLLTHLVGTIKDYKRIHGN